MQNDYREELETKVRELEMVAILHDETRSPHRSEYTVTQKIDLTNLYEIQEFIQEIEACELCVEIKDSYLSKNEKHEPIIVLRLKV